MKIKTFFILLFLGIVNGFSLSFIFLLPLILITHLIFLKTLFEEKVCKKCVLNGWVFGFGFFLGSMHWIISPFLVYEKHFFLAPLVIIFFPFLMGVFFAFTAFFIYKIYVNIDKNFFFYTRSFLISFCFFVSEILRSKILGGLPLNLTAHLWAFNSSFILISKYIGVFGLSLLTINWLTIMALTILEKRKSFFLISPLIPLILLSFSFYENNFLKKQQGNKINIRIVQPNIPQEEKWNRMMMSKNIEKHIKLSKMDFNKNFKTIVVWPEVAIPFYLNEEHELLNYLRKEIPENFILITGALKREFDEKGFKIFNSLYVVDEDGFQTYEKHRLVPFGEFIPLKNFLQIFKLTEGSTDFSEGKKEPKISILYKEKEIIFEPSICYEAIFQSFNDSQISMLINITNDAWFGKTIGPRNHLAASIFRSVEKGVPLIRAANSGISVVTNGNGKIQKELGLNLTGFIDYQMELQNERTFFINHGNFVLILILPILISIFFLLDYCIFKKNVSMTNKI